MSDNKGRIIFLEHYLLDHADENDPVTTEKLITVLTDHGYSVNRNTLRSDLAALQAAGIGIASVRVANAKGYYVKNRPFSLSELKALIDAVSSSQFIPERNSNAMIRRLAQMAPEMHRKDLTATAFCADRIKTDSPVAFTALDAVNKAVRKYQWHSDKDDGKRTGTELMFHPQVGKHRNQSKRIFTSGRFIF